MSKAVILADGSFPVHQVPLEVLNNAEVIVCCDGSASALTAHGLTPSAIVGDMDSISPELKNRFADRIFIDTGQETNDLTKAVEWSVNAGFNDLEILGAGGKREDHTIGNISLLAEYARIAKVRMITDSGVFIPMLKSGDIESQPGQQVSIFSIDPVTEITSSGLVYPLLKRKLTNWWQGTLNEAEGNRFDLRFESGTLIIFLKFL